MLPSGLDTARNMDLEYNIHLWFLACEPQKLPFGPLVEMGPDCHAEADR
jgi:hypothetical protein